ncbi:hypothetical protein AAGF08_11265 [Algoriphagus sp. SE2]
MAKSEINFYAKEEKEYIDIFVEDNGVGISEENLQKLKDGISFTTKG